MASIIITVDKNTGLFTIQTDSNGWVGLSIFQGLAWEPVQAQNNSYQFIQTNPGPLQFRASATGLAIVNPPVAMAVGGPFDNTYVASIAYTTDSNNDTILLGSLLAYSSSLNTPAPGPTTFSQINMTGAFGVTA